MLNEELQDELVQEVEQVEEVVEESAEVEAEESQEESEADEVVVTIGDEPQPEEEEAKAAPQWVRDLRKADREKTKRIRELESQLEQNKPKAEVPALGAKPTLEGCDYDAEVFEKQYDAWVERKRKIDEAQSAKQREEEEKQKEWQTKLDAYATSKESLRVKDYEDAEEVILGTLAEQQQAIIVAYAENPALVVYALGKNPKKAQELSAIKDPVKFAIHVSKLESQLKVQSRKPSTQPERVPSGTAPKSGAVDGHLDRLRAEAEKTGDYSKVSAYKRQQREKANSK